MIETTTKSAHRLEQNNHRNIKDGSCLKNPKSKKYSKVEEIENSINVLEKFLISIFFIIGLTVLIVLFKLTAINFLLFLAIVIAGIFYIFKSKEKTSKITILLIVYTVIFCTISCFYSSQKSTQKEKKIEIQTKTTPEVSYFQLEDIPQHVLDNLYTEARCDEMKFEEKVNNNPEYIPEYKTPTECLATSFYRRLQAKGYDVDYKDCLKYDEDEVIRKRRENNYVKIGVDKEDIETSSDSSYDLIIGFLTFCILLKTIFGK